MEIEIYLEIVSANSDGQILFPRGKVHYVNTRDKEHRYKLLDK